MSETNKKPKKWMASEWVDGEIDNAIDLYGNTPEQAIEFVLDMLAENQYRDELTDRQTRFAIAYLNRIKDQK